MQFICAIAKAQVPSILNYQGRLAVSGTNFDGTGQFMFALISNGGTTTYWSNDGTSISGSQPTNAVSITVSKGLYSVLLGDTTITNMTAVPVAVFANSDVLLRVWFNDGAGEGWQQLAPDQRIAAVGFAMVSGSAATSGSALLAGTSSYAANSGTANVSGSSVLAGQALSGTGGIFGSSAFLPASSFDPAGAAAAIIAGSNTISGVYNFNGTLSGTSTIAGTNESIIFGPQLKTTALSATSQAVSPHTTALLQSQLTLTCSGYNGDITVPADAFQSETDMYMLTGTDYPGASVIGNEFAYFTYGTYPLNSNIICAWAVGTQRTQQINSSSGIIGFQSHLGNQSKQTSGTTTLGSTVGFLADTPLTTPTQHITNATGLQINPQNTGNVNYPCGINQSGTADFNKFYGLSYFYTAIP